MSGYGDVHQNRKSSLYRKIFHLAVIRTTRLDEIPHIWLMHEVWQPSICPVRVSTIEVCLSLQWIDVSSFLYVHYSSSYTFSLASYTRWAKKCNNNFSQLVFQEQCNNFGSQYFHKKGHFFSFKTIPYLSIKGKRKDLKGNFSKPFAKSGLSRLAFLPACLPNADSLQRQSETQEARCSRSHHHVFHWWIFRYQRSHNVLMTGWYWLGLTPPNFSRWLMDWKNLRRILSDFVAIAQQLQLIDKWKKNVCR